MKQPTSGRRSHQGESGMNKTALTTIAPDIYRKRLIVEGYFLREITEATLLAYFAQLTRELGPRTYADPIIHRTAGQGKAANEGFAGYVPLVDPGAYVRRCMNPSSLSTLIYPCAPCAEDRAVRSG